MTERLENIKSVGLKVGQIIWSYGKTIVAGLCLLIGLILIGISFIGDTICYGIAICGQKICSIFNTLMGVDDKYVETK